MWARVYVNLRASGSSALTWAHSITKFTTQLLLSASDYPFLCMRSSTSVPLHSLARRFFGGTDVEHVLDAMEYAVYQLEVQHIIIDNLQFMLSSTLSPKCVFGSAVLSVRVGGCRRARTHKNMFIDNLQFMLSSTLSPKHVLGSYSLVFSSPEYV